MSVTEDVPKGQKPLMHATNGYMILPSNLGKKGSKAKHPIFELMENAEKEWNAKLTRQSKTLKDAVFEYRRRYHRAPPRGFDKWWKWAQKNKIILVDEYDQIMHDLEPFYALDPRDLDHKLKRMEEREETFTIKLDPTAETTVEYSGDYAELQRAHDLGEILEPFADLLPGKVQMTFTRHDQPACQLGWARNDRMKELALQGECA